MKLIKLADKLGLVIIDYLKKFNIEPRKLESGSLQGLFSFEFTQEELDLVTELVIINPQEDTLIGIENLRNLEVLSISTSLYHPYQISPLSISDNDINRISKLNNLKSLCIDNQCFISTLDLNNFKNLEKIQITRNASLEEIIGLDKLYFVKEFIEFGNKELFFINNINELINNNNLDILELDFLHFNEVIDNKDKLVKMVNCNFLETIGLTSDEAIHYSFYQMLFFHQKARAIAMEAKKFSIDKKLQIIFVEFYLAKNVLYDSDGRLYKNRAHFSYGKQKGKKNGTNSAYNGLVYGYSVCEGFVRSMQYILKLLGTKSKDVDCIGGPDKIIIKESYNNQVCLPDNGYHSIIRIEDNNCIYYCDPCWDSYQYHNGNQSLPFCLLTKKEMEKIHSLSFEENVILYDIPYPREYILKIIQLLMDNSTYNIEGKKYR